MAGGAGKRLRFEDLQVCVCVCVCERGKKDVSVSSGVACMPSSCSISFKLHVWLFVRPLCFFTHPLLYPLAPLVPITHALGQHPPPMRTLSNLRAHNIGTPSVHTVFHSCILRNSAFLTHTKMHVHAHLHVRTNTCIHTRVHTRYTLTTRATHLCLPCCCYRPSLGWA